MSLDRPEHLREETRRSTWWVGRGAEPSPWWIGPAFAVAYSSWSTFTSFLSSEDRPLWVILAVWAIIAVYVGWAYWSHRTGRDLADNRFDRWASAHPAASRIIVIAVVLTVVGLAVVSLD
jgi:hypothetical protein